MEHLHNVNFDAVAKYEQHALRLNFNMNYTILIEI
jgi:hypothetical protein